MDVEKLARICKALSNENRVKVLEAIRKSVTQCALDPSQTPNPESGQTTLCCVDQIVGQFDMAQSTVSQHLKELYQAGLLERHKKAQWVYYTVNHRTMEELSEYLGGFGGECCRGA